MDFGRNSASSRIVDLPSAITARFIDAAHDLTADFPPQYRRLKG
jgi:hypothetical protein